MYSFDRRWRRSMTLRPEGTAPICRAYIEHGMHKLPQPVKFLVLRQLLPFRTATEGRYRQFWQVGAEVIGAASGKRMPEIILLMRSCSTRWA